MSVDKKKLSGSQKRKIRKEKEYNINSKYAKLDKFLISSSSSSCACASSSNARELDEQGQAHPGIHNEEFGESKGSSLIDLLKWQEFGWSQADATRRLNMAFSVVQRVWHQIKYKDFVSI
ncbi:hypothetical protein TNCV_2270391 [Trichonephila clavipes]|nr:hypothetical protein TNCV_2270391 [Trichonephila clavipes]